MDKGRTVTANFSPDLATNQTPHWWLALHYGDTNDFNTLAMSDSDGDSLAAWQEYRAGTIPTNILSRFTVSRITTSGDQSGHVLYWNSLNGRIYTIYTATQLDLPDWSSIRQVQGTNGLQEYTDTNTTHSFRLYRLGVDLE